MPFTVTIDSTWVANRATVLFEALSVDFDGGGMRWLNLVSFDSQSKRYLATGLSDREGFRTADSVASARKGTYSGVWTGVEEGQQYVDLVTLERKGRRSATVQVYRALNAGEPFLYVEGKMKRQKTVEASAQGIRSCVGGSGSRDEAALTAGGSVVHQRLVSTYAGGPQGRPEGNGRRHPCSRRQG